MENKCYVSYMANDRDIKGVLLLSYNLNKIGAQYKYYVIITEYVSENVRNTLKINNISVIDINFRNFLAKYTDDIEFINEIIAKHYYGKYLIFSIIDFNKMVYLDTDMLIMDNIDHLLELDTDEREGKSKIYMVNDMLISKKENNNKYVLSIINNMFNSGLIVYKPSLQLTDKMYRNLIDKGRDEFKKLFGDQDIFNELYKSHELEIVPLNFKYNISPYLIEDMLKGKLFEKPYVIHFMLKPKPWDLLDCTVPYQFTQIDTGIYFYKLWINLYLEMINKKYLEDYYNNSKYADEYYYGTRLENGEIGIINPLFTLE